MNYDPKGPKVYVKGVAIGGKRKQWWIWQNREFELTGWPLDGPYQTRSLALQYMKDRYL